MSTPIHLRRRAAAEYLRAHWGIPCAEKTLAKLACVGGGPVFFSTLAQIERVADAAGITANAAIHSRKPAA